MERIVYRTLKALIIILAVLFTISCSKRTNPAEAEISEYADKIGSAAVLVMKDGKTVYSYGDSSLKYLCHSIRKPFLGALYGIYKERGLIDLNLTLEELGIDDIPPELTPEEKRATIRDLLMSRSGVYHEAGGEVSSMIAARPERGSHEPGTFFYYNNWDFNTLGTIFTMLTGKGVFEAFDEEIAKKIGMEDFYPDNCRYIYEEKKSLHPLYFFRMSTRDMARFGQLFQKYGSWEGVQIISEDWIRESTAVYPVSNPGGDPYGYMWRIIPAEAGLGYGFYHTGLGVHLLAVLPEKKLVFVYRLDTDKPFTTSWPEIRILLEMIAVSYGLLEDE